MSRRRKPASFTDESGIRRRPGQRVRVDRPGHRLHGLLVRIMSIDPHLHLVGVDAGGGLIGWLAAPEELSPPADRVRTPHENA